VRSCCSAGPEQMGVGTQGVCIFLGEPGLRVRPRAASSRKPLPSGGTAGSPLRAPSCATKAPRRLGSSHLNRAPDFGSPKLLAVRPVFFALLRTPYVSEP